MNTRLGARAVCILTMTFVALALVGQDGRAEAEGNRDLLLDSAREIMTAARFCALATVGDSDAPSIREMDPFPPDEDMTVWHNWTRCPG